MNDPKWIQQLGVTRNNLHALGRYTANGYRDEYEQNAAERSRKTLEVFKEYPRIYYS